MLLEQLKKDALAARKAAQGAKAALLTTLIAEAESVGKNDGNRTSTDIEVERVVRAFLKNIREVLALAPDPARRAALAAEADILSGYLPAQADERDVRAFIEEYLGAATGPQRAIGAVMGELKKRFGANFDAKRASQIAKECL